MSRRRTRAKAQAARVVSVAPPPVATDPREEEREALHRMAIERRDYRLGRGPRPARPDVPRSVATGAGTLSTTVPVAGMTCRTCEVRIERYVGRLPGVERVSASAVHGRVEIETTKPIPTAAIAQAIGKAGYEIGHTPWLVGDPKVWGTAAAGLILVGALAVLANLTGIGNLAAGAGDLGKGGIAVALLLGLAAGVSTCMALVGGLVLALSASFKSRSTAAAAGEAPGLATQMRPAAVFMTGRVAGYAAFGAILGVLGASVAMPPGVTGVLMILVAVVMTLLGTRLTGLSPRVASWSPTLPMGLGRRLGLGGGEVGAYSDTRAAALGAASFFLPCGFTQAVQIYALSTGSPLFAAALLATFAIGTAPGLLALAGLPVLVPTGARPTLLRLVGVVVLAFAFVNGSAGIRLSGLTLPSFGVEDVAAAPLLSGGIGPDGTQALTTYQDLDGYSPANVSIYAGIPTTWTIESSNAGTCASVVIVPRLGIRALLHTGSNTIALPALPAGRISYTCSMGMYGGNITVVGTPAGTAGGTTP